MSYYGGFNGRYLATVNIMDNHLPAKDGGIGSWSLLMLMIRLMVSVLQAKAEFGLEIEEFNTKNHDTCVTKILDYYLNHYV